MVVEARLLDAENESCFLAIESLASHRDLSSLVFYGYADEAGFSRRRLLGPVGGLAVYCLHCPDACPIFHWSLSCHHALVEEAIYHEEGQQAGEVPVVEDVRQSLEFCPVALRAAGHGGVGLNRQTHLASLPGHASCKPAESPVHLHTSQ